MSAKDDYPEFLLPLRVYIEDTDAGGIVYYVNYLKYMERARTEFMRRCGVDKAALLSSELMFVVYDARVQYREPARLDDELLASARVTAVGAAAIDFRQRVLRDGCELASGDIRIACVDRQRMAPARLPAALRQTLKQTMEETRASE